MKMAVFFLLFSLWDHRDGVGACHQLIAEPYMSICAYLKWHSEGVLAPGHFPESGKFR